MEIDKSQEYHGNPNVDRHLFKRIYDAIRINDLNTLREVLLIPSHIDYLGWEKWSQWVEDWETFSVENITPLEMATELRNLEMIKLILEVGCNLPDWRFPLGRALQIACETGDLELVRMFLKAKADIGHIKGTPYMKDSSFVEIAVSGRNLEVIRLLLEFGFDINGVEGGTTPLMVAVLSNDLEIVKYLVEAGADVNRTDDSCWETALTKAADNEYKEIVDYLKPLSSSESVRFAKENFGKFT